MSCQTVSDLVEALLFGVSGQLPPGRLSPGQLFPKQLAPRKTALQENCPKDELHPRYFFPRDSEIVVL